MFIVVCTFNHQASSSSCAPVVQPVRLGGKIISDPNKDDEFKRIYLPEITMAARENVARFFCINSADVSLRRVENSSLGIEGWAFWSQDSGKHDVMHNRKPEPVWYDQAESDVLSPLYEEEDDKPAELLGSWKTDPEDGWVKVDSVVDSGASASVAPPTMAPNAKLRPSAGSRRGRKFTSASKHKLANLGEQLLQACTEDGTETQVLFQIADVSRPLVSVSAITEMGNRVIFGISGGVVQCLKTGRGTPFYKRNGIYVLSMWIKDSDDSDFVRP